MKATITIILGILSLATFSEGTDGNPTIWNVVGIVAFATLAHMITHNTEKTK